MPALKSPFTPAVDRRLRLFGPVVLFLIGMMFFRLKMYLDLTPKLLLNQVIIALTCGYIGWELTRLASLFIQNKLPGRQRTGLRVISMVLALLLLAHFGYVIRVIAHNIVDGRGWSWPSLVDYSDTTGVLLFYTSTILGMYEIAYLIGQWKQTAMEKETLIKSEWQSKYDLLKAQVNPHFLFNGLNTLSSLITEDPQKAEQFTHEMSSMYRYLLKSNDEEQATLQNELQFIKSYGHLLAVRYGEGLRINIEVDPRFHDYLLPALTLQLLVENAVKHNIISKQAPLFVTVSTDKQGNLIVENNLQKKTTVVHSTGLGLKNIREKYKLLQKEAILISDGNGYFTVSVPLIQNNKPGEAITG